MLSRQARAQAACLAWGRAVTGNAELVERAAALAGLAQRPPMLPDEARVMLGVNGRH